MGGKVLLEALGELADVDVDFLGCGLFWIGCAGGVGEEGLGEFLGGADGELAADDLVRGELLGIGVFQGEDGLGVADGDLALGEVDLDVRVEIEQAHRVGDGGAGFADAGGDLFLLEGEFLGEPDVSGGFLDGVEILALEVLDEGHFQNIPVRCDALDDRDGGEAEFLRSAPAALTGDEFVFPIHQARDERLDDAVLADGLDEIIERRIDELVARLERGGNDIVDGDVSHPWRIVCRIGRWISGKGGVLFDKGAESFAECLFCHGVRSVVKTLREGKRISTHRRKISKKFVRIPSRNRDA